jgi:chromosome partitioning protein
MTIFAFIHHKGGTGKTTACLQSAGFLRKSNKKVLVIDIDPQANATLGLGVLSHDVPVTIYHVLLSACINHDHVPLERIIMPTRSGIDLAPSNLDLIGAEPYLYQYPDRYTILHREIGTIKDKYDYILIDTPPFLGQFVLNAILAADYPVFVFSQDVFAMAGYENIKVVCEDIHELLGKTVIPRIAVLNRWHLKEPSGIISSLKDKIFGKNEAFALNTTLNLSSLQKDCPHIITIPDSSAVSGSYSVGMPLAFTNSIDPAAKAYAHLSEVMMQCQ